MMDNTGSKATLSLDFASTSLAADVQTAADTLRPLLEAITGCAIISQSITYTQIDDAQPKPNPGSRVEHKGMFVFRTAAGKTVTYQIPAISAGIMETGRIDDDHADIAAVVAELVDPAKIYTDSNGQKLTSLIKAYERYRSSTRAMLPSMKETDVDKTAEELEDPVPVPDPEAP
jgi:hypothetical protein